MAIVSRIELEDNGTTEEDFKRKGQQRSYERALFQEALRVLPVSVMKQETKRRFSSDSDLKDTYLADLLDNDKQDLFEQKLGTGVLRAFSNNKTANMLRNDAVHSLKKQGVVAPRGATAGAALDVTNRKAFDVSGQRRNPDDHSMADVKAAEQSKFITKLQDRRVDPEEFGVRTHSVGDKATQTLYFAGKKDALSLDAPASFEYDGVEMGSGIQGVLYAQATAFNDPNRALDLSAEPMTRDQLLERKLFHSPYTEPEQRYAWDEKAETVIYDVLKAKYAGDKAAQEMLKQTKGYRLMYAIQDDTYGIGHDLVSVSSDQEEALRKNEEFILRDSNPDRGNIVGRVTERVRTELLQPEQQVSERDRAYGGNPFGQSSAEYATDMRTDSQYDDYYGSSSSLPQEDPFATQFNNDDAPRSMRFDEDDVEDVGFSSRDVPDYNEPLVSDPLPESFDTPVQNEAPVVEDAPLVSDPLPTSFDAPVQQETPAPKVAPRYDNPFGKSVPSKEEQQAFSEAMAKKPDMLAHPEDYPNVPETNGYPSRSTDRLTVQSNPFAAVSKPVEKAPVQEPVPSPKADASVGRGNPFSKPLEMSVHASQSLTENGMVRASEAVKRFAQEAKGQDRAAIVYVSEKAPKLLKKAVYANIKDITMVPLTKDYMPQRALIVQSESVMSREFQDEIQHATSRSLEPSRDVRALSIDPNEAHMYALNDYLMNKSEKVRVAHEMDGVESGLMSVTPKGIVPTQEARDLEQSAAAVRMNAQYTRNAQESAKQRTKQSAANPAKGIYSENPFG